MTGITQQRPLGTATTLARFVGRRHELADVRRQMEESRLVTLTGPGGIGKTRLALEAAFRARKAFPDGVWPVELASVEDGREVASTAMLSLAAADQSSRTALERLIGHVKDLRLLLILDNCEHVLEDTAKLVATLLDVAPGLHVLATSREPLGISGEQVYVVPPLAVPPPTSCTTSPASTTAMPCASSSTAPTTWCRTSRWTRGIAQRCGSCASGSTACRWPSSSPRHGCARSRSARWSIAWTTASSC